MKKYWVAGIFSGAVFLALIAVRFGMLPHAQTPPLAGPIALSERETWMNLFQGSQKIGFSQSILTPVDGGYRMEQLLRMRLNTMGMIQDVTLQTTSRLRPDLSFESFEFHMNSGRFQFKATGVVSEKKLIIDTEGNGGRQRMDLPVPDRPHLASVLYDAVIAGGMQPGETRTFDVFDISTLEKVPITVNMKGKEKIILSGAARDVSRITLTYKGLTQSAWISEEGEVLKEEGLLGMRLEKTDARDAVSGIASRPDQDLTVLVSVPVDKPIEDPHRRDRLALQIEGLPARGLDLDGGRQTFSENIVEIQKESLLDLTPHPLDPVESRPFLEPTIFIQSEDEGLEALSKQVAAGETEPLAKIEKIVSWMNQNIEKRPVVSIPDALSVLKNRSGDCNEHAVLLAAMTRAVGIPAAVEAGLAYLNGRFYYHAWNRVHVGRWITVDALFNQIPADVTHIRLISGAEKKQTDLLPVLGKIRIRVIGN